MQALVCGMHVKNVRSMFEENLPDPSGPLSSKVHLLQESNGPIHMMFTICSIVKLSSIGSLACQAKLVSAWKSKTMHEHHSS